MRKQSASIDPAAVSAIDVHVHVLASVRGGERDTSVLNGMATYFGSRDVPALTVLDIAGYYRDRGMAAVVFGVDQVGGARAHHPAGNDEITERPPRTPTC